METHNESSSPLPRRAETQLQVSQPQPRKRRFEGQTERGAEEKQRTPEIHNRFGVRGERAEGFEVTERNECGDQRGFVVKPLSEKPVGWVAGKCVLQFDLRALAIEGLEQRT